LPVHVNEKELDSKNEDVKQTPPRDSCPNFFRMERLRVRQVSFAPHTPNIAVIAASFMKATLIFKKGKYLCPKQRNNYYYYYSQSSCAGTFF
jgi:hypothetical protein